MSIRRVCKHSEPRNVPARGFNSSLLWRTSTMLRQLPSLAVLFAVLVPAGRVWGQVGAPPRSGSEASLGNEAPRSNSFEANKPVAMTNKIIKPVPLSADTQGSALKNMDKNISDQVGDL